MYPKSFRCMLVLLLAICTAVSFGALPIEVENYSFEDPNIDKIVGWDREDGAHYESFNGAGPADVPGWESDGEISDSGVESGYTTGADGDWTGFIMAQDPPVYNLTDFIIGSGDAFELQVYARDNWSATDFELSLYYDDNGTRVTVASEVVPVTGDDFTNPSTIFSLSFAADDVPASYGHQIGIQLANASESPQTWIGVDNVQLTLTSPLYRAYNPSPVNKGIYEETSVNLAWTRGPDNTAISGYDVYLSSDLGDVENSAPAALQGTATTTRYTVSDLIPGSTYYWRIDTNAGANVHRGDIWQFTIVPTTAYSPSPAANARYVPLDTTLTWLTGLGGVKGHVIVFGDDFDEVNEAPLSQSPGTAPYRRFLPKADTDWAPSDGGLSLEAGKTYYWRVDEVEVLGKTFHKGEVWSFETVPVPGLGSITREVWLDIPGASIADLTDSADYPDNPTETTYQVSFDAPRRWGGNYGTRMYGWLYVETTGDYTFWIAADENGELWLENDLIATNTGAGYHVWTSAAEQQSEPIHLDAGNLYYIMALQKQGEDDGNDDLAVAWSDSNDPETAEIIPGRYLLPYHMHTRVWANIPSPPNGAVDLQTSQTLAWHAGAHAVSHQIYFGTDAAAVEQADTSTTGIYQGTQDVDETSLALDRLAWGTTYYWRVDEVNDLNPEGPWKGPVWSFTTGEYALVDDFESYPNTGDPGNRIFEAWRDKWEYTNADGSKTPGNGTGMTVGVDTAPYGPERGIVHSGLQALPLTYDNSAEPYYAETDRTFDDPQDWTVDDGHTLTTLSLQLQGRLADPGRLTYNAAAESYTLVGSGNDIWNTADQFQFAYLPLNGDGSITVRVDSIEDVDAWAKAGVMIRDSLDAGSMNACLDVTPDNLLEFITREIEDIESTSVTTEADSITLPHWLRLRREGAIITGEHSADGQNWDMVLNSTIFLSMTGEDYIGLAVTSRVDVATTCHGVFSRVEVTGTSGSAFDSSVGIGLPVNDRANLYIELEDSHGMAGVWNDPRGKGAVLTSSWRSIDIPLTVFSDQNVDLTQIQKMIIGVGDKQPDGTGKLYIDDIRLYGE